LLAITQVVVMRDSVSSTSLGSRAAGAKPQARTCGIAMGAACDRIYPRLCFGHLLLIACN
jgi:hypothetical protein